ncbi:sulfatase-like hydrolase/transferase [Halovenus salina]|uniref:sulfatase-like hydrolase/transferase n=1 Tax=Halovenus salina TaxID=1510225 RepID=UPI00226088C0|nr:sulfatase-like hydrolase/transferase [Halovenus salina]
MGLIERFGRAARNPRLFARGMNRLFYRRVGLRHENPEGIDVFDEDWDTLVVLDACRFDMFEQVNHLDGTVTARESKGSATAEWLQANVDGRALRDTVYVTSNPQLERNRDSWDVSFHHVDNVWFDHGWDKETGTVLAETMTEAAINAYEQFPNKRLVVHYMQPHYPFVPADTDFDKTHLDSIESGDDTATGENVWNMKFMGQIDMSRNELWDVYTANLEYVLEHVEDLLEKIPGKSVITSDHGNYVGERAFPIPIREYGHPRGLYDTPLVRIPWFERTNGERRTIRDGSADERQEAVSSSVVTDRLQDLGYKE